MKIVTHDIQVFNTKTKEWELLGYEKKDLPMFELRQEVKNIALVEDDPIKIVELTRQIKGEGDNITISDPIIKQVGKVVNKEVAI